MTGKEGNVSVVRKNGAVIVDFNAKKARGDRNVRNTDNVPARKQTPGSSGDYENAFGQEGQYPRFDMNEILALYRSGDPQKKARAIEMTYLMYRRYVLSVARSRFGSFIDGGEHFVSIEDFLSAGNLGLIEALDIYNPQKGKFTTCCKPFVLGRMSEQARLVIGVQSQHYSGLQLKVNRAIDMFHQRNIEPTVEMLAQETKLSRMQVLEALDLNRKTIACGAGGCGYRSREAAQAFRDAEERLMEEIPYFGSPEEIVLKKEFKTRIDDAIGRKLQVHEGEAVRLKYGFYGDVPGKGLSYPAIAKRLGVSESKARYIVQKALRSLGDDAEVMDLAGKLFDKKKEEDYPLDGIIPVFEEKDGKKMEFADLFGDELRRLLDLDPDTLLA